MHIFNYISHTLRKTQLQRFNYHTLFIPCVSLILFIMIAGYISYPDEFVNLLGGKYILAGKLPYRDFFDHHMPLPWYLAAGILSVSLSSFVIFRYIWVFCIWCILMILGEYIRRENKNIYHLFKYFLLLYPFFSIYYWLHVFLADSLAFLFFSCAFWLILSQTYRVHYSYRSLLIASLCTCLLVFSSMTYIYIAGCLYLWIAYLVLREEGIKKVIRIALQSILPYLTYVCVLLITGTFDEFWMSNIVYNTKLYINIPHYIRGNHFNPIKFMLTLIFNFYQGWIKQLTMVHMLDVYFPIAMMMVWSTFIMMWMLLIQNRVLFALYFLMLSFSAPRSDVSSLNEANYQASVYIALGLISTLVVLWKLKAFSFENEYMDILRKIAGTLVIIFFIFSSLFLVKNMYDKMFQRYTQVIPGIYDLSDLRNFSRDCVSDSDIVWAGPYLPQELFYFNVDQLPGKYISLLPQMSEDHYFSSSFLNQFKRNPPSIIVYKHSDAIFGNPADKFGATLLDWMSTRYNTLDSTDAYSILRNPTAFTIGDDVHIRNDIFEETVKKLEDKGYIKPLVK